MKRRLPTSYRLDKSEKRIVLWTSSGSVRRQNKGLPAWFPAYEAAFCGFSVAGTSLARVESVSLNAYKGSAWYAKRAERASISSFSSGFFADDCGQTRGESPHLPQIERLLWVSRVEPLA